MTEPDFMAKFFFPKNGEMEQNGPKIKFLEFIEKFVHYIFFNLVYNRLLFAIFLHKYHTWEEPDRRIFKTATYLEQNTG